MDQSRITSAIQVGILGGAGVAVGNAMSIVGRATTDAKPHAAGAFSTTGFQRLGTAVHDLDLGAAVRSVAQGRGSGSQVLASHAFAAVGDTGAHADLAKAVMGDVAQGAKVIGRSHGLIGAGIAVTAASAIGATLGITALLGGRSGH